MASVIGSAPAIMKYLILLLTLLAYPFLLHGATLSETVLSDANQINAAVNSLPANGGVVVVQNVVQSGVAKVVLTRSNVTIKFINCQIQFAGAGVEVEGANDSV